LLVTSLCPHPIGRAKKINKKPNTIPVVYEIDVKLGAAAGGDPDNEFTN
jgi:hypothetical protein